MQSFINTVYRNPRSEFKKFKRFGGYLSYRKMMSNNMEMQKAAQHLAPVHSHDDGLPIYFLTGKKYLYQTLFCIQSLTKCSAEKFKFIIIDDGTFDDQLTYQLNKQLPGVVLITSVEVEKNLQKILPKDHFPVLHNKRREYPHIKKLIDIHTLSQPGWKLVLDSDMLFLNNPEQIINWLSNPARPIHMIDCADSYGYSHQLMVELAGAKIQPLLNVGVVGLNSNNINWEMIENWVRALEDKEGKTYYLEQALSAMIIADEPTDVLNANEYIVNPSEHTIVNMQGVLQHYVDLSKKGYFNLAWRRFFNE